MGALSHVTFAGVALSAGRGRHYHQRVPSQRVTVTQAYRFALDPTPTIERAFFSHCGGARYAYNWGLAQVAAALDLYAEEKAAGAEKPTTRIPGHFDLCKRWTAYKDDPISEVGWVGQNFVGTYQAALRDAATAWKNFFASRSGKRGGRRMGRPRFKAKHRARRAFQVHGETLQVVDAHHLKLPKIGQVKTHESTRKLLRRITKGTARIVRGTIAQDSRGRWHIALTVTVERDIRTGPSARQRAGGAVGIDLGVRDVATLSDGTVFPAPRHLARSLCKIQRLSRSLSRKAKGSRNRAKAQAKLGRAHGRVASLRDNATHHMTTAIVHRYEKIAVEGWDVQATAALKSPALPRHVRRRRNLALADANPGNARWQLESKSVWYGATVVVADQHAPTGRTCSACGQVRTKPVPPAAELFQCSACGHSMDRRINTAKVLRKVAELHVAPSGGETLNARGEDVRPGALRRSGQSSSKREARTRPRRGQPGTPGP